MESWKSIKGFEDSYAISNLGNIKSKQRSKQFGRSVKIFPEKILKQSEDKDGYMRIGLSKNSLKKMFFVHRLVAMHFINNSQNLPLVNHKDGVKNNNVASNLEWCDSSYNAKHAFEIGLSKSHCGGTSKKVAKINSANNELITIYKSMSEASRNNDITTQSISYCANGKQSIAKGFKWKFIDEGVTTNESTLICSE